MICKCNNHSMKRYNKPGWDFAERYAYGKAQETALLPILRRHFGEGVTPHKNSKSRYDFYEEKGGALTTIEVKSRTNRLTQYPTTLLRCNKVRDTTDKQLFVFNFTDDKLGCIEYNREKFAEFAVHYQERYDEGLHYLIPIDQLRVLEK